MNCYRCSKSDGGVIKNIFKPNGEKIALCARCRKEIDKGATFDPPRSRERPSRWKRKMEKEDKGEGSRHYSDDDGEKYTIAAQKPFSHCPWGRK